MPCAHPWRLPIASIALLISVLHCSWVRAADENPRPDAKPDPMIQKIVGEISEERVADIMRKLETFQTRNTMSDPTQTGRGVGAAREWILEQFKSYSPRLQASLDTYTIPRGGRIYKEVELSNVIAILPGKQTPDRWILVSGHYDTVNLRNVAALRGHPEQAAELPAPGVSDDASGTACAMECARVMSQYEFDATLVFVAFAGEEQGLRSARTLMAKRMHAARIRKSRRCSTTTSSATKSPATEGAIRIASCSFPKTPL